MISAELVKMMCCPETHQELRMAEPTLISGLNDQIEKGTLKNCVGRTVAEKLETGLIRADGKVLYPIRQNIPVMLAEEAIAISV